VLTDASRMTASDWSREVSVPAQVTRLLCKFQSRGDRVLDDVERKEAGCPEAYGRGVAVKPLRGERGVRVLLSWGCGSERSETDLRLRCARCSPDDSLESTVE